MRIPERYTDIVESLADIKNTGGIFIDRRLFLRVLFDLSRIEALDWIDNYVKINPIEEEISYHAFEIFADRLKDLSGDSSMTQQSFYVEEIGLASQYISSYFEKKRGFDIGSVCIAREKIEWVYDYAIKELLPIRKISNLRK